MAKTKPMTPAEYRANAQRKRQSEETVIKELASGAVFELRRPDLQGMVLTGRIPQSLVNEGLAAWKRQGKVPEDEEKAEGLNQQDVTASLIFMREIVHECTVNPKFVEFATADNEIGAADMLKEDFMEIFSWAMGHEGVTGLDGLKSFREGRERGTSGGESGSEGLQSEAVAAIEA